MDLGPCRCPLDGAPLIEAGGAAACPQGHRFPIAGGFVDLATEPVVHEFGWLRALLYDRLLEPLTLRRLFGVSGAQVAALHGRAIAAAGPGVVADVPCGSGLFSVAAAGRQGVARYLGLDASGAMLRRARRRITHAGVEALLVRGDLSAIPFRDGIADAVVSSLGLQFVPDHERALGELRRILKPQGHLLAIAPALGLREAYDRRHARRARQDFPLDRDRLEAQLEATGLTGATVEAAGALLIVRATAR